MTREAAARIALGLIKLICRNEARSALSEEVPDRRLSRDVRLHGFLVARVEEMRAAIQQTAITDFNAWLVHSCLCKGFDLNFLSVYEQSQASKEDRFRLALYAKKGGIRACKWSVHL